MHPPVKRIELIFEGKSTSDSFWIPLIRIRLIIVLFKKKATGKKPIAFQITIIAKL